MLEPGGGTEPRVRPIGGRRGQPRGGADQGVELSQGHGQSRGRAVPVGSAEETNKQKGPPF